MNIYSLPAIISFTVNFSLAFIVLMDKPKKSLNRWFAAFIFNFSLWNIAEVVILNSGSRVEALIWAQLLYRLIFLAPAFFVIIAYHFPRNFHDWSTKPLFYIAVFSLPFLALSFSFPNFQIELIPLGTLQNIYYFRLSFRFSFPFFALMFISLAYMLWGTIVLIRKIPGLKTVRLKNQTRFFTVGMVIVFITFIAVNFLRPYLEQDIYGYFLSTLLTFLIAAFLFVAIVQFHLFKPSSFISRGLSYSILYSFVLAVYFLIIKGISDSLNHIFGINSYTFEGLTIFILILLIQPFIRRLERLFDRLIKKDMIQHRKSFLKLSREIQSYYPPHDFFEKIRTFLKQDFNLENVYIFALDPYEEKFIEISRDNHIPFIPRLCPFTEQMLKNKHLIEFYDIDHQKLDKDCHNFFESVHIRIILPLIFEDRLLAFLALPRKKYGIEFTEDELTILSIFSSEIATALLRNQMIEEMREHDRQHFQLEKLASLGQLTAGIAHEIRNPLNTISTSAETLMQQKVNSEDEAELKRFIIEEANRLNRVLSDFLNLSRIRPPQYIGVNLPALINRLQLSLENEQKEADFSFLSHIEPDCRRMMTDPDLLFQSLLNLGLNSIAAINDRCRKETSFECRHGRIEIFVSTLGNYHLIRFCDNGCGIPEEIQDSVFDPFFTTKPAGTGLGLAIVKQIIEALNGYLDFTSEPGKTCFRIRLPRRINRYNGET